MSESEVTWWKINHPSDPSREVWAQATSLEEAVEGASHGWWYADTTGYHIRDVALDRVDDEPR